MQETQVHSLDQEYPLEKEIATHSGILAWYSCLLCVKLIALNSISILTILILPRTCYIFPFVCVVFYFFHQCLIQSTGVLFPLVGLLLGILFFLMQW